MGEPGRESDGEPDAPRRPRRRRAIRVLVMFVVGLAAVTACTVAFAGYFAVRIVHAYDPAVTAAADTFPADAARPEPTDDLNVLLLGLDSGEKGESGGRTDTMMLVHVESGSSDVQVVSIMRDLWVDIPGHGMDKINAARVFGGSPLVVQTVESLLPVRIDHVVAVDFAGLRSIVDALGGIDVDNAQEFTSAGTTFARGITHLDGTRTLRYVRERAPFADADFTRVKNQQAVMRGITTKLLSAGVLAKPWRIANLAGEVGRYLTVDEGLDKGELASLGYRLRGVRGDTVHYSTIPVSGSAMTSAGQSILLPDTDGIAELGRRWVSGGG